MKAMILSAGYGKRLRPLTDRIPKPLVPVGGNPSSFITLKTCRRGLSGNRDQPWPSWLENSGNPWRRFLLGLEHRLFRRGPRAPETGGGITKALPLLGEETFLVVNGDVWCDLDFSSIPGQLPEKDDALLFLVPRPEWREKGDFSLAGDRVVESDEPNLLYAGIALYHPGFWRVPQWKNSPLFRG